MTTNIFQEVIVYVTVANIYIHTTSSLHHPTTEQLGITELRERDKSSLTSLASAL